MCDCTFIYHSVCWGPFEEKSKRLLQNKTFLLDLSFIFTPEFSRQIIGNMNCHVSNSDQRISLVVCLPEKIHHQQQREDLGVELDNRLSLILYFHCTHRLAMDSARNFEKF